MTCSNYEKREREREWENRRWWRVRNTANMRVDNRGESKKKKKHLKLLHNDLIYGGNISRWSRNSLCPLVSQAAQNIWTTQDPTKDQNIQSTKPTGDTRTVRPISYRLETMETVDDLNKTTACPRLSKRRKLTLNAPSLNNGASVRPVSEKI